MSDSRVISVLVALNSIACGGGGESPPGVLPPPAAQVPAARSAHSMVYDEARRAVLLYGGAGASTYGDLWSWDGQQWRLLSAGGPPPRDDAVFAYDARRQRAVLYGGRAGQALLSDTWEWDGTAWTRRDVSGPGPRLHAVGAYDRQAAKVRLYGGVSATDQPLTDTWEWDGQQWTRVATASPGRIPNQMAYDASRQRTVLLAFDPQSQNADRTQKTELWEWSGSEWTSLPGVGPGISPIQQMTSLGDGGGVLLFDGGALQGQATTWIWRAGAWRAEATGGPSVRNGHALALDAVRGRVVLFGGFLAGPQGRDFADTWEWDGARWTQVTAR